MLPRPGLVWKQIQCMMQSRPKAEDRMQLIFPAVLCVFAIRDSQLAVLLLPRDTTSLNSRDRQ